METTTFDFVFEVENLTAYLPGVADALSILRDKLDTNLRIRQSHTEDMECYLRISSAMGPALMELARIQSGLQAAINAVYAQKKEGRP